MKKTIMYLTVGLALFGLPFIAYTSEEYVGAKKCKTCHIKIYKKWQKAAHSEAYTILSPGARAEEKKKAGLDPDKDYSSDPGCIQCHTTGNSTQLPGVHCEACHGAGKKFTNKKIMSKKKWKADPDTQRKLAIEAGLIIKPDEKTCTTCHNEKSPTFKSFDFAARYEEIKHKKKGKE